MDAMDHAVVSVPSLGRSVVPYGTTLLGIGRPGTKVPGYSQLRPYGTHQVRTQRVPFQRGQAFPQNGYAPVREVCIFICAIFC